MPLGALDRAEMERELSRAKLTFDDDNAQKELVMPVLPSATRLSNIKAQPCRQAFAQLAPRQTAKAPRKEVGEVRFPTIWEGTLNQSCGVQMQREDR